MAHRRLQWACNVSMIVFAATVTVPAICLPEIGREFGLSLADRGLLGSLRMAALLSALLLSGYLADRLGKARFLTVGMVLVALGTAGTSLAGGYLAILGAQAVVGLGTGSMEALVNPLVAELHPKSPARPLNITNGLFSVGLVLAAVVTGEMLQSGSPWRMTLWLWVVPAAAASLLFATRRYPRIGQDVASGGGWGFLGQPLFWMLVVAMAMAGGCEAGMTFWGANFMERELGATPRGGAMTVAFFGALMAIGRFTSGGLVARVEPPLLTAASAAACALATAGLCFVQTPLGAWIAFGLGGLFVACFWPTILAIAAERVQVGSTTMFALLAAAGITGCMIFPWAIGAIGDAAGLRVGVGLLPVAMVLQTAILVIVWRRGIKQGPAS